MERSTHELMMKQNNVNLPFQRTTQDNEQAEHFLVSIELHCQLMFCTRALLQVHDSFCHVEHYIEEPKIIQFHFNNEFEKQKPKSIFI